MTLSAKARANIASLLVMSPYAVAAMLYREDFSERAWAYVTLCSFLLAMLAYQWVYHRHSDLAPASSLPRPELHLSQDPLPGVIWLALVPPAAVLLLLAWVIQSGDALPWRDNWLGPPRPALSHRMFPMMATAMIVWNSLMSWRVVHALARWHGMSRAYPHRQQRLRAAVAMQWLVLVVSVCWASGNVFYMPAPLATLCALINGGGMFVLLWQAGREERLRRAQPATGTWCYFDFRDPTFLGPRGLNLANGWSWVLAAAGVAPILLAEWLFHQGRMLQ